MFNPEKRFVEERLGWNMRMTNMPAALGLAQLERSNEFVAPKRAMGSQYTDLHTNVPGIQLPLVRTPDAEIIYCVYDIDLNESVG